MARAPKYTIKRSWGWMTKLGIQPKKRRARAPKPAFADLRGLGRASWLAASALGTVLIVSPVVVNKAFADETINTSDFPYNNTMGGGDTLTVQSASDCSFVNATCIDVAVVQGDGSPFLVNFVNGDTDLGGADFDTYDAIVISAWFEHDDIDITIDSDGPGAIDVDGTGILVYADGDDQLGNVEIIWKGDITTGNVGVGVGNEIWGTGYGGNVGGDVKINVGDVDSGLIGVGTYNIVGNVTITTGDIDSANSNNGNVGGFGDNISVTNVVGDVTINAGNLTGGGADNDGVFIDPIFGDVNITTLNINKDGDDSDGIEAYDVFETTPGDGGNITIQVNGNIDTSGDNAQGVEIYNVDNTVSVTVTGDINTGDALDINDNADGLLIGNVYGSVTVDTGNIDTFGFGSDGVEIFDVDGIVDVTVDDISTNGNRAEGIDIQDIRNDVFVDAGDISTDGRSSDGVDIDNVEGSVDVKTGDITSGALNSENENANGIVITEVDKGVKVVSGNIAAFGDSSDGIEIYDVGGVVDVKAGNISTDGDDAQGVEIYDVRNNVIVDVLDVTTDGDYAQGVVVGGYDGNISGSVTISTGDIETSGEYSDGVQAGNISGAVDIDTGDITTGNGIESTDANGVDVFFVGGNVDVVVDGDIETNGYRSDGVSIYGVYGEVDVKVTGNTNIKGDQAQGAYVQYVDDDVTLTFGNITTDGEYGFGILAGNINGDVNITTLDIDTDGNNSSGVFAYNVNGDVAISTGNIETDGNNSMGVQVGNISSGDVAVNVDGDITTTGNNADGVHIQDVWNGGVTGNVYGDITTTGVDADGVFVDPIYGDFVLTVHGDLNQTGADSDGLEADDVFAGGGEAGNVIFTVKGDVNTNGDGADGIDIFNIDGSAIITIEGDVDTSAAPGANENANGILIGNVRGGVSVVTGNITTSGNGSDGVEIYDVRSDVFIDVFDIQTGTETNSSNYSNGVVVSNIGGSFTALTGNIETNGDDSAGVDVLDVNDAVKVTVNGDITTDGESSEGIIIYEAGDDVTVTANNISTEGDSSEGIIISNVSDDTAVSVYGNVSTDGESSEAIYVRYAEGDVEVNVYGDITTNGPSSSNDSEGIKVNEVGGNVEIAVTGTIRTLDGSSDGIDVEDVQGTLTIDVADIYTSGGGGADGIEVDDVYGNVNVIAGNIGTAGENADGVDIETVDGFVVVTTEEITTLGNDSDGITIGNVTTGDVTVTVNGDITTDGDNADGVAIYDVYDGGATGKVFGNITTSGINADGVFVDPIYGDFIWTVYGDLNQTGAGSDGLELYDVFAGGGEAGNVIFTVTGDVNTNGDDADGIDIYNIDGSAIITIEGDIDTAAAPGANEDANGILIGNVRGGVSVDTGNITTSGEGSDGVEIFDVAENVLVQVLDIQTGTDIDDNDNANGVVVSNIGGGVTISTGSIETNGDGSDGVEVYDAFNNNALVDITTYGNVTIHGNGHGVFVHDVDVDDIEIAVNGITTEEDGSHGVNVNGNVSGDTLVTVNGDIEVTGEDSYGVNIGSRYDSITGDANVNIVAGASIIAGDVDDPEEIGETDGEGDSENNDAINIYADGTIEVNIDGYVTAGDEVLDLYAYGDENNVDVNIGETGTLRGRFQLYTEVDEDGDVVIDNRGTMDLMGYSYIGADEEITINNFGTVQVTSYESQFVQIYSESDDGDQRLFNNRGNVTLADGDGDATDILALGYYNFDYDIFNGYENMDFNGGPGSRLVVDTFLAGPDDSESDQLWIYGDVTGTTELVVVDNDPTSPGAYNVEGITVVWVYGDTQVGDFTLAGGPIDKGLFVYDLYLKDDSNVQDQGRDWVLASIPGQAAHEAPTLVTGIQELGHQAMASGLDRMDTLGDCAAQYRPGVNPTGDVPGCDEAGATFWMTLLGRGMNVDRDSTFSLYGQSTDFDISYDQVMWGMIGGADGGKIWTNENGTLNSLYGGVLGGYLSTTMDFDSGSNADYSGGMAGVYGGFESGAWFVNGVVSAMFGNLSFDNDILSEWGGTEESGVFQLGGVFDTGYRWGAERGMGGVYFEPGVTLSILSTSIDDAEWAGNEVAFDDNTSIRGRIGAKVGYATDGGFETFVEASLWNEFGDDPSITISSLGSDVDVSADGLGTWGDIGLGFEYTMDNWAIGAKGDVAVNQDFIGYGGSVKVQFSW